MTLHPFLRCRARQQNQCCFCFDQTINASGIFPLAFLSFLRLVGCNPAKKAPLCKGSCRPAPTEGLRCSVTLVPCRDGQTFFAQVDTTGQGKDRNGSSVTLVPCRDGQTLFVFLHTICQVREHNTTAQALGPK